jgi:DEAD/DEAH box helicase/Helicase conserved C-terminal domain
VSLSGRELKDLKLLPYQTDLVDKALNPASKRFILLRADVGLGKTSALVALAGRLLQERPMARALLLAPGGVLRMQFVERLRDAGVPTLAVDSYQYRKMLDSTTERDVWPGGVIAVLSAEYANQPDILESLASTHWNLIIVDEAHQFWGYRAETLRRITASAERVILASATLPEFELPLPADDTTVVEWRRDQLIDGETNLLNTVPPPILHEVPVRLTSAELGLHKAVRRLCDLLEKTEEPRRGITLSLMSRLQSSPLAVEGVLRRLAEGLTADGGRKGFSKLLEGELTEDHSNPQIDLFTNQELAGIAEQALAHIDEISSDSKLNAFWEVLWPLMLVKSHRICVLTDYRSTLFYLAAEIESLSMNCTLLHGGMNSEDRKRSLASFANEQRILVATRAAITERDAWSEVTDLVLYDIPSARAALLDILRRFNWFDRRNQLTIHALAAMYDGSESEPFRLLREILDSEASMRRLRR